MTMIDLIPALKAFNLAHARVTPLPGGLNRAWLVHSPSGACILKRLGESTGGDPGHFPEASCAFMEHLHANTFPCPKPIRNTMGES